jgi:hypothetical protein
VTEAFGRQATPPAELVMLQRLLVHAFCQATPVAADSEQSALFAKHVAGNDRLSPAEQVDIYRRQFWLRHEEVVLEDYPGLAAMLGSGPFTDLTDAYLNAHPPRDPNLRDLGAGLPAFLTTYAEIPEALRPAALDMARYELAFVDVFDALDPPPLDANKLLALAPEAWEHARLVLSPWVKRMRFDFPVHRMRLAARAATESETELEVPEPRPVHLALFRRQLVVHFEELEADAFVLLDALGNGDTLLAACERIASGKTESEAQLLVGKIGQWFRFWAENGFIAEVVVSAGR